MIRCLLAMTLLTTSLGAFVQAVDAGELRLSWQKRYLEISGDELPGDVIRIHYLEAYCRPGSTDQEWGKTVIPHESQLVDQADDGKRIWALELLMGMHKPESDTQKYAEA